MIDYINYAGLGMAAVILSGMLLRVTDSVEARPVKILAGLFAIIWASVCFAALRSKNYPVVAGCLGVLIALITSLLLTV